MESGGTKLLVTTLWIIGLRGTPSKFICNTEKSMCAKFDAFSQSVTIFSSSDLTTHSHVCFQTIISSGIRYFNFYESARFDQRGLIQMDPLRMKCVGFQVVNRPRQSSLHVKLV